MSFSSWSSLCLWHPGALSKVNDDQNMHYGFIPIIKIIKKCIYYFLMGNLPKYTKHFSALSTVPYSVPFSPSA